MGTSEGLRTLGVHFDVVDLDMVVMVDVALLAMLVEEPNKESKS